MNIGDSAFSRADFMRRLHELEGIVRELVAGRRLENATVGAGGITFRGEGGIELVEGGGVTIRDNGILQLLTEDNVFVVRIGPDSTGKQAFQLRRDNASLVMYTAGSSQWGRDYWAFQDNSGNIIVSDDAETGYGLARPWLPVVLYPKWGIANTGDVYQYAGINTADLPAGETQLWEGRASIQHPWITVDGVWGRGSGDVNITYRLKINGTTVGEWTEGPLVVAQRGRFDVSDYVITDWAAVEITVTPDAGTGLVACQVLGCYLL